MADHVASGKLCKTWQIFAMSEEKLKKQGHVLVYARNTREPAYSQPELAALLVDDQDSPELLLKYEWLIKNGERNRQQIPVWFVELVGKKLRLKDKWWQKVPESYAAAEKRRSYPTTRPPKDVELPLAPADRSAGLRALFMINKNAWTSTAKLPYFFTFPGRVEFDGSQYPDLFVVEIDKDDDALAKPFDLLDLVAIRPDLEVKDGKWVLVTTRDKRRVIRKTVVDADGVKFVHLKNARPALTVSDIVAIEGLVCGLYKGTERGRPIPDSVGQRRGPVAAFWIADGFQDGDL